MSLFPKKLKDLKTLEKILDDIEIKLEKFGYTKEEKNKVRLSADELSTNAVSYTTKPGSASINYSIKKSGIRLKVKNKAEPFDWSQRTTPEYFKKIIYKKQISGRGIYITNKFMDELRYEFKKGYVIAYARYKRK